MIAADGNGRAVGNENTVAPSGPSGGRVVLFNLTKRFGDVTAVREVDLQVEKGEFVSLLGPSGSGKTTTLMMIAGFEDPTSGAIEIDGHSLQGRPAHKRNIGMVFQSYALFPHMTVAANVSYPLSVRGVGKAEVHMRVKRALDVVRLPHDEYATRYPRQLSGGQQQRVALARALVFEPRVLLMDEPMGALDKNLRVELQDEIRSIHQRLGVTIIYVTHDQEEAITLSDRVAVFNHGSIVQIGTPQAVYSRPKDLFVAQFLGEANVMLAKREQGRWIFKARSIVTAETSDQDARLSMVRPENTVLVLPGEGLLSGSVSEVKYLGIANRVAVDTEIGPIVARVAPGSTPKVGSVVGVAWANEHIVQLRR